MKAIILLLLLLCVPAKAQPLVPTPEDIKRGYLESLYEMLLQNVKNDNFGAAKVVAAEIDEVAGLKVTSSNLAPCGTWIWLDDGLVTLYPGGNINSGLGHWHWVNEEERRLQIKWNSGYIDNLVLSKDLQKMTSKNNRGWKFTVHRLPQAEQDAAANP